MDSLLFTKSWNDLPIEVKLMVVKHLGLGSRLALRACSVSDFQLVESVPFRKIYGLRLTGNANWFYIGLYKNSYGSSDEMKFLSFETFQKKLTAILDTVDYITQVAITVENTTEVLNLTSRSRRIKVGRFSLPEKNSKALLQQVEASVLELLDIGIKAETRLYDQVESADLLRFKKEIILDNQLIELTPNNFWIVSPRSLISSGIYDFIQKYAANPNFKEIEFLWLDVGQFKETYNQLFTSRNPQSEKSSSNSLFPEFEIRLNKLDNTILMRRKKIDRTDALLKLRKINDMIIELDRCCYKLIISEKYEDKNEWSFDSPEQLQECLTIKMKTINYIKRLEINLEGNTCCLRFIPPESSKQITVGHAKIFGCNKTNGQTIIDMLEQIEPGYLKCVFLYGERVPRQVYDLQQVIQANYIDSTQSDIQDDQLLKLNAETLHFARFMDHTPAIERITVSGANNFIKKLLLNVKNSNYEFKLVLMNNKTYWEFILELLEGLDIFTMKLNQELAEAFFPSEVTINSEWDDIKLVLIIDGRCIEGRRINV